MYLINKFFFQQRLGHRSFRHESNHGLRAQANRAGQHAHPKDPLLRQKVPRKRKESRVYVEAALG
jgi:hypothetical protein